MFSNVLSKKKSDLDGTGQTVKDVIDKLIGHYGKKVQDALYDVQGNFDPMIQIALNGESFITADRRDTPLQGGDSLIFMILLVGG